MTKRWMLIVGGTLLLLALAACGGQAAPATSAPSPTAEVAPPAAESATQEPATAAEPVTNAVAVSDQSLGAGNTVTIDKVTSDGPGWLVIHADADGGPGPILGYAPVSAGDNDNVTVEIDVAGATETLYAMLHVDAGAPGEYEFPGPDGPAMDAGGNVVTPPFTVSGLPGAASPSLTLADSPELGAYLSDANGMALYTFANDAPGASNCVDRCAENWPPLLLEEGAEPAAGANIPGELGTTVRGDGATQVTYDGRPLYYWINDAAPGDTTGHNVGNVWSVARPDPVVLLGGNDDLGRFLVGPEGMTLYRFNNDEPGTSNCTGDCAANWPALTVEAGRAPAGDAGVVGQLGTAAREDGALQVTYEGMPLYYWANDQAPGEATGQGINDVWFVVTPYTVGVSSSEELGDFVVGANGMTLYHFTNDGENQSNCTGACAENWPPLVIHPGEVPVAGFRVAGELGVIEREDGALQVTYGGMPLYFWANDQAPGDTTGQGVNDVWFVVAP